MDSAGATLNQSLWKITAYAYSPDFKCQKRQKCKCEQRQNFSKDPNSICTLSALHIVRHFRKLRIWICDNHCDLTIKSHTGHHSQFVQCFLLYPIMEMQIIKWKLKKRHKDRLKPPEAGGWEKLPRLPNWFTNMGNFFFKYLLSIVTIAICIIVVVPYSCTDLKWSKLGSLKQAVTKQMREIGKWAV